MKNSDPRTIFCRNVAWLRRTHGLSQKEMAQRLHIGLHSLRKIEQGLMPPRLGAAVLLHIHDVFGILPEEMFSPLYSEE